MPGVEEMYERVKSIVEGIDSAVRISGGEGHDSIVVGKTRDHPQFVEVEFDGSVDSEYNVTFLEIGNRTEWEFFDEDDVFSGDSGGLVTFERSVDPEEVSAFDEFDKSERL